MLNSKTVVLTLLVAASVVASALIHHGGNTVVLDRDALLRRQSQQLADLQTEQWRLSNLVARATNIPAANRSAELAKLRAEAEALRKQTNELSKHPVLHPPLQSARSASPSENHTPEYWKQFHQAAGTKSTEAM